MAGNKEYTVLKGDTLSEITESQLGAPVYGKKGNMQKVLEANSNINNPDLILVDQKIQIPFKDEVNVQLASRLKNKLTGNIIANQNKKSKWDFALDANAFVSTLSVQGTTLDDTQSVYSGLAYGATGNVYYEGTDWFQMRLELGLQNIKYEDKEINFSQDKSTLASAKLGSEFLWDNQILIGIYGGIAERLIATQMDQNSLTIKRKAIGQIGLGTAFVLSELGKNKMALGLNGNLLFENSGREFGAELSIIRSRTTIKPFLNYTTMDTAAGRQDDLRPGLGLSYQL